MPRVRAAAVRFGSTCSKAPLADRYIRGKDIVTAAMTVAPQEKAILMLKKSRKNFPSGRFTPNRYSRKNPATVGGSTRGSVRMPSRIILARPSRMLTTSHAARIPRKNVIKIDRLAVFIDIQTGDQSMAFPPPVSHVCSSHWKIIFLTEKMFFPPEKISPHFRQQIHKLQIPPWLPVFSGNLPDFEQLPHGPYSLPRQQGKSPWS